MVGAILAGGAGSRMGGSKAARILAGRPLMEYPTAALSAVCDRVAIVGKPGVELLVIAGVERWDDEPPEPRHPAAGIAHALACAREPVLVCAADMPFVTSAACRRLVEAAAEHAGATAVVAAADGDLQPLLGVYAPAAGDALLAAAEGGMPLRRAVEELGAVPVELSAALLRGVNTPADLGAAETELVSRGRTRRQAR